MDIVNERTEFGWKFHNYIKRLINRIDEYDALVARLREKE
jgi:hypothetical protein